MPEIYVRWKEPLGLTGRADIHRLYSAPERYLAEEDREFLNGNSRFGGG